MLGLHEISHSKLKQEGIQYGNAPSKYTVEIPGGYYVSLRT
jgi:hypothetical protein